MSRLTVFGLEGIPEVKVGDDVATLIAEAALAGNDTALVDGDVIVVTQKIVSKAEDRLVAVDPNDPLSHKPLVERESVRILRRRGELIISETVHGFVCANAGIDLSNVERGWAALLPVDSDRSARRIRDRLRHLAGVTVGVVISDTFGRTWRRGVTDVAIGCAGIDGSCRRRRNRGCRRTRDGQVHRHSRCRRAGHRTRMVADRKRERRDRPSTAGRSFPLDPLAEPGQD
jgi:coenzyme F420-0:L-glutamate ligase/coenzyme F420-1:gamma-L-glutamate ligase